MPPSRPCFFFLTPCPRAVPRSMRWRLAIRTSPNTKKGLMPRKKLKTQKYACLFLHFPRRFTCGSPPGWPGYGTARGRAMRNNFDIILTNPGTKTNLTRISFITTCRTKNLMRFPAKIPQARLCQRLVFFAHFLTCVSGCVRRSANPSLSSEVTRTASFAYRLLERL